jgi:dTMP kinase
MKRGKFIVVEGIGGSGKSTLVQIAREVYPTGKVHFTREIGGSPFAEEIRKLLLTPMSKAASVEAMVMSARTDHVRQTVSPALFSGKHVLSDRFDSSTYAHQIFGCNGHHLKDLFWQLRDLFKEAHPDLYIFLDIEPMKGIERARARNNSGSKANNYFDDSDAEYHGRVYEGYMEFFKSVPHKIVDASQPLEKVKADFLSILDEAFAL